MQLENLVSTGTYNLIIKIMKFYNYNNYVNKIFSRMCILIIFTHKKLSNKFYHHLFDNASHVI